jgi:hypothetical protein
MTIRQRWKQTALHNKLTVIIMAVSTAIAAINALPLLTRTSSSGHGGSVSVNGDVSAGNGTKGPGADLKIEGGTGYNGASGGDVNIGPGEYKAGNGGAEGGRGGDLTIKGGDAK